MTFLKFLTRYRGSIITLVSVVVIAFLLWQTLQLRKAVLQAKPSKKRSKLGIKGKKRAARKKQAKQKKQTKESSSSSDSSSEDDSSESEPLDVSIHKRRDSESESEDNNNNNSGNNNNSEDDNNSEHDETKSTERDKGSDPGADLEEDWDDRFQRSSDESGSDDSMPKLEQACSVKGCKKDVAAGCTECSEHQEKGDATPPEI